MSDSPNPWEALGLPAQWQPVPLAWHFAKLDAVGPAGPTTAHVLIVRTCNGAFGFGFSADELRSLGEAMIQQATGITIAQSIEGNGHLRSI